MSCEFSLFYSWEHVSFDFHEWTKGYPVLVLALLKIQPILEDKLLFGIETDVIKFLKETFKDNVNLFASMGRSEILLILRGNNLGKLLRNITELRETPISKIIDNINIVEVNTNIPIFIDSTSFPAIIHPTLHGKEEYHELEGMVLPMVDMMCYPGYEKIIASQKIPSCSEMYNFYGNYDLTMLWNAPVAFSEFAKDITKFRNTMKKTGCIKRTYTTFLVKTLKNEENQGITELQLINLRCELVAGTEEIIKKAEHVNLQPMVKSSLIEFIGRLNTHYNQLDSKSSFNDMLGIHHSINWTLGQLDNIPTHLVHRINNHLSEIVDLSNNAIFQRYSGLETRFDTCKQLPLPFLRGVNGFIAAASCIPCFIIKSIFPKRKIHDAWPGFVVFGLSYSYQLFIGGRILSFPASSLLRPIEDWWGITHEVTHLYYYTVNFRKDIPPEDVAYLQESALSELNLWIDIEEICANWFDFVYIFQREKIRYFPMIWKSWLRWKRVWERKDQYIFRSFMIFLSSDLEGLRKAQLEGHANYLKYINSQFDAMRDLVMTKVPEFAKYISDLRSNILQEIAIIARRFDQFFLFLEDKYFDKKVYDRLNPEYPDFILKKHLKEIDEGYIITEDIPSPVKLLHSLYDKYTASNKEVPIRTTAATVLTLWHKYMKDYNE